MTFGKLFRIILAYETATCFTAAVNTLNTPVICGQECCPLLAGDSTNEAVGTACGFVDGDFLRIEITLNKESCEMTETHICNIPAATLESGEPETKFLQYFLDMETVYDFTCAFIGDSFLVAGHVTIECDDKEETSLQAYYEVEICCEELSCPTTTVSNDVEGPFTGAEFVGVVDGEFAFATNVDFEVMAANPSSADSSFNVIIEELKDGRVIAEKTRTLVPGEKWFEKVSIRAEPSAEKVGVRSKLEKRESSGIVRHLLVDRSLQGTRGTECEGRMEDEKEQRLLQLNKLLQCHEAIEGTQAEVESRVTGGLKDWFQPVLTSLVPREIGIQDLQNQDPSLSAKEAGTAYDKSFDQITDLSLELFGDPVTPIVRALLNDIKSISLKFGSAREADALRLGDVLKLDVGTFLSKPPFKVEFNTPAGAFKETFFDPVQDGWRKYLQGNIDFDQVFDGVSGNINDVTIIKYVGADTLLSVGKFRATFRAGLHDISVNKGRGLQTTKFGLSLESEAVDGLFFKAGVDFPLNLRSLEREDPFFFAELEYRF